MCHKKTSQLWKISWSERVRIYRLIDTKYGIHGRIRAKSDFKRSLMQTEVNKLRLRKEKYINWVQLRQREQKCMIVAGLFTNIFLQAAEEKCVVIWFVACKFYLFVLDITLHQLHHQKVSALKNGLWSEWFNLDWSQHFFKVFHQTLIQALGSAIAQP